MDTNEAPQILLIEQMSNTRLNTIAEDVKELKSSIKRRFKLYDGLILFGLLPTLQALGIPTKELAPVAVKFILGFIGFH